MPAAMLESSAVRQEPGHTSPDLSFGGEKAVTTDTPLVSVIVPAYNAAPFIAETLASILGQSYPCFEVIVVNDGSPDTVELERILEPFMAQIRYVKRENGGPGAARNSGILAAKGDFIAFIDGDDIWSGEHLEMQIAAFRKDKSLDLVYSDALLFGDGSLSGQTYMTGAPSAGTVTFEALVDLKCAVLTSTVVARKSAVVDAGLFDEQFMHVEDFDLWARMVHSGARLSYCKAVTARRRLHPTSLAADQGRLYEAQIKVYEKLRTELSVSEHENSLLIGQQRRAEADLDLLRAKSALAQGDFQSAVAALSCANRYFGSKKLSLAIAVIRVVPRLVRRLYLSRENGWAKARP